jgi:hypothetical protein
MPAAYAGENVGLDHVHKGEEFPGSIVHAEDRRNMD